MSDTQIIQMAMTMHRTDGRITDLHARVIASNYHGGMGSRFYALASTGTIDNTDGQLGRELEHAERAAREHGERTAIDALKAYIADKGTRGPVPNWSNLTW